MTRLLLLLCCSMAFAASAAEPVFDVHVHLHDGEASLRKYRADVAETGVNN